MIQTILEVDKPFLSLNYDSQNDNLTGDTSFFVTLNNIGDDLSDNMEVSIDYDNSLILIPDSFTGSSEPQRIDVRSANGLKLESGDYNLTLKIKSEYATDKDVVSSLVVNDVLPPPAPIFAYKLKYFILRDNYRLNIFENVLVSEDLIPIEINGTVDLSYQEKQDLFSPIIASSIKINLQASEDRDFSDLYNEDEKHFKVQVIKGGKSAFIGFILPDGIWEDYVADKWNLQITAADGLASLKNISFSNDNGLNFYGRMTAINILNICLSKTGLNLPIVEMCQVVYTGWAGSGYSILSTIYLSVERYFQNESDPMDCQSVLNSLMQIFNLTLVQQGGEWNVYRSVDLRENCLASVWKNGLYDQNRRLYFGHKLGSQINNFQYFHCSANQSKTISASVQAYQISYEYGESKNILANGGLILEGTGFNIPGWTIQNTSDGSVGRGVRDGYSYGVRHAVRPFNPQYPLLLTLNQSISIKANSNIKIRIKFRNSGINSLYLNFRFGVRNATQTVYFKIGEGFGGDPAIQSVRNAIPYGNLGNNIYQGAGDAIFEGEALCPINGDLFVEINKETGGQQGGLFGVASIDVSAASTGNIKSKDYLGRRTQKTSTNVKTNVTVYNGDSGSDLFVGTIYKSDSDTPTSTWNRVDYVWSQSQGGFLIINYPEAKELLEINAEDNLRISPRPMTVYEGDFKGFIPYMTFVTIDKFKFNNGVELIDKKFQFLKYSYSFDDDITKSLLKEYEELNLNDEQFKVTIKENYGNEVKPTILG